MTLLAQLRDRQFEVRICGMSAPLAQELRNRLRETRDNPAQLQSWAESVYQSLKNIVGPLRLVATFGSPVRDTFILPEHSSPVQECDVLVSLMTDPTDIDSKQATCISGRVPLQDKERIFNSLYKFLP
eukprot:c7137_g1_i1.p1 GENE.c7137_g1_i1~~c7137_g1_i1.p1  ORF type:complete len:128 (-),score=18.96 c7137_g1_i1:30-413(-)